MHYPAGLLRVVEGCRVCVRVVSRCLPPNAIVRKALEEFFYEVDVDVDVRDCDERVSSLIEPIKSTMPQQDAFFVQLMSGKKHLALICCCCRSHELRII